MWTFKDWRTTGLMEDLHNEVTRLRDSQEIRQSLVIEGMKKTMDAFVFHVTTSPYQEIVKKAAEEGRNSAVIVSFEGTQFGPEFWEEAEGVRVKIHPFFLGYLLRGPTRRNPEDKSDFFEKHGIEKIQDRLSAFFAPFQCRVVIRKNKSSVILKWD